MKTKSLLLGSAAALFAVTGARAADAVIIPEPEVVEYVRVCDAAGTGYFYIPGTETCLKIGGYARFQISFGSDSDTYEESSGYADFASKASLQVSSWTDSEIGPIETFFEMVSTTGDSFAMDSSYLSFAGVKMGYFGGFLDNGINGETDGNGLKNKFDQIQYSGSAGGFTFGVSIDELNEESIWEHGADDAKIGVEGMVGFTVGGVNATLVGFYDMMNESGGFVARASADVGMGTLQGRFTWSQDDYNGYAYGNSSVDDGGLLNWVAEASYAMKVGDKTTVTPGFSWTKYYDGGAPGHSGDRMYAAGLTVDHKLAANLAIKAHVEYVDFRDGYRAGSVTDFDGWNGFLRFQASF